MDFCFRVPSIPTKAWTNRISVVLVPQATTVSSRVWTQHRVHARPAITVPLGRTLHSRQNMLVQWASTAPSTHRSLYNVQMESLQITQLRLNVMYALKDGKFPYIAADPFPICGSQITSAYFSFFVYSTVPGMSFHVLEPPHQDVRTRNEISNF